MRRILFGAAVAVVPFVGCGGDPFPGTYSGTSTTNVMITSPTTMSSNSTDTASATITMGSSGNDILMASTDGGTPCSLTGTRNGNTLTFTSGQTCAVNAMNASGTITLTMGTATLNGTAINLNTSWTLMGTTSGIAFSGTVTLVFMGTRPM
jgi:hypothetical protein